MGRFAIGRTKSTGATPAHSIALWCTRTTVGREGPKPNLEFHVNLWRLEKRSNGVDVNALDVGLLLRNAKAIENLYFYLPFSVDVADVSDLTQLLEKPEIAIAIFNDNVLVTPSAANVAQFSIDLSSGKLSCWKLNVAADIVFQPEAQGATSGVTMKFKAGIFSDCPEDSLRYVRFRIGLSSAAQAAFFTRYDPIDQGLLSGYDETEVVDFRFNEKRNLSRGVVAQMNDDLDVTQINYFVIRDMIEDLTLSHQEPRKCRTLEPDVWSTYIAGGAAAGLRIRHAIIFYWRKDYSKEPFKDFNALARFRRRKTSITTILKSVGWLVGFGILSGWIASAIPTLNIGSMATTAELAQKRTGTPAENAANRAANRNGKRGTPDASATN